MHKRFFLYTGNSLLVLTGITHLVTQLTGELTADNADQAKLIQLYTTVQFTMPDHTQRTLEQVSDGFSFYSALLLIAAGLLLSFYPAGSKQEKKAVLLACVLLLCMLLVTYQLLILPPLVMLLLSLICYVAYLAKKNH